MKGVGSEPVQKNACSVRKENKVTFRGESPEAQGSCTVTADSLGAKRTRVVIEKKAGRWSQGKGHAST